MSGCFALATVSVRAQYIHPGEQRYLRVARILR